jgi:hypothetical protein
MMALTHEEKNTVTMAPNSSRSRATRITTPETQKSLTFTPDSEPLGFTDAIKKDAA